MSASAYTRSVPGYCCYSVIYYHHCYYFLFLFNRPGELALLPVRPGLAKVNLCLILIVWYGCVTCVYRWAVVMCGMGVSRVSVGGLLSCAVDAVRVVLRDALRWCVGL